MARPTNREILTRGDAIYARKKRKTHGVEEVKYDPESRKEYLTGFHKRKLQRKEKAKERAKEMERQERLSERQRLREERKEALAKDLKRFNEAMKDIAVDSSDEEEEEEHGQADKKSTSDGDSSDYSDWEGPEDAEEKEVRGVLKKKYMDDEGDVTTVTIEEMNIDDGVVVERSQEVLEESVKRAQEYAKHVKQCETEEKKRKQRKKKFRYLTTLERKRNVSKERLRNKEKKNRAMDRKK